MRLELILGWLSPFLVFSLHIAWVSSCVFSLCYSFFLLLFDLFFVLLSSPFCATLFFSSHCSGLLFTLLWFLLHVVKFSSLHVLFSSHCWAFFFTLLRSPPCTILNFFSRCWNLLFMLFCFPPHDVGLSFVMLLSFSHCLVFLFVLLSSLVALLFQVQGFLCCCSPFRGVVIHWKILYYPLTFLLARIENGQHSKMGNLYFFNKFLSLCFLSHVFCSFVLIFFAFGLWCMACYKLFWRQT